MVEVASSKNATLGAFSPPQQSEGATRGQSPEAMAIEDNLAGPTKHERARCKRAFLCVKVDHTLGLAKLIEEHGCRPFYAPQSLGSGAKPCRHNLVSRFLGFVVGHFCGESWRTDIKAGRVLEPPNNVGRQFPLTVTCDAIVEYLTD